MPSLKLNPGSHTACSTLPALCSCCGKTLCDAYFYFSQTALRRGQRSDTEILQRHTGTVGDSLSCSWTLQQSQLLSWGTVSHWLSRACFASDKQAFQKWHFNFGLPLCSSPVNLHPFSHRSEKKMQHCCCTKQALTLRHWCLFRNTRIKLVRCLWLQSRPLTDCCRELHCITHSHTRLLELPAALTQSPQRPMLLFVPATCKFPLTVICQGWNRERNQPPPAQLKEKEKTLWSPWETCSCRLVHVLTELALSCSSTAQSSHYHDQAVWQYPHIALRAAESHYARPCLNHPSATGRLL